MAKVDLSTSRALAAFRRQSQLKGFGWQVGHWLAILLSGLGGLILLFWVMQIMAFANVLIGSAFGIFGVSLLGLIVDIYRRHQWSALPELPPLAGVILGEGNLADYLSFDAINVVREIQRLQIAKSLSTSPYPVIFLALVGGPTRGMLARANLYVPDEQIQELLGQLGAEAPLSNEADPFELVVRRAAERAVADGRSRIDDGDLVCALFELDPASQALLAAAQIELADLADVASWFRRLRRQTVQLEPLYDRPIGASLAQDWTAGYTPFLSRFAFDLTDTGKALTDRLHFYGKDEELAQLEQFLGKASGHNILLVGQPGIGKKTLILALANKLVLGKTTTNLSYLHILALDLPAVLAGLSDRGELEARLLRIFHEAARAGNTILFIEDIHLLIGGGDRVGGIDASELLVNVLRSSSLRVIATTTPTEYQSRIGSNPAMPGLFERLDMAEPLPAETLEILLEAVLQVESVTGTFFTIQSLKKIVTIADQYLHDQPEPAKALNLLQDVGAAAQTTNEVWITPEIVQKVLSDKLALPLQAASNDERDQLLHLEDQLHATVVGQEEAITAIATALRRARAGLASSQRPIASFLFLGPTGVGKTESAKALARVYFGASDASVGTGEERMIRLDMSEYQQTDALVRLIGALGPQPGTKIGGDFADRVHDQPFSLILLDELEKAHPQVLNVFLQVLDDGRLTDGTGRLIDFTNTIIIATSNAGAELIRQSVATGEDQETRRTNLLNYLQTQGIYRPEFLNRFDGIVAFRPLTPEQVRIIVGLMLKTVTDRLVAEQNITVTFDPDVIEQLAARGFDPQFGARPIRRLIQDTVEQTLAKQILEGSLTANTAIQLTAAAVGLNTPPTPDIVQATQ